MRRGNFYPGGRMSTSRLIWLAFGRRAAKQLESGLGCTRRQAWRIVSTGHVPAHLWGPFIDLIDRTMAERRQEFMAAGQTLRDIRDERAVRAVEKAACGAAIGCLAQAAGPADGATHDLFLRR